MDLIEVVFVDVKQPMNFAFDRPWSAWPPKRLKKKRFFHFVYVFCTIFAFFRPRDQSQRLLQALASNFPSKMQNFDAYVSSCCLFPLFLKVLESCKPLFDDLAFLFHDFETWEELLKGFEKV